MGRIAKRLLETAELIDTFCLIRKGKGDKRDEYGDCHALKRARAAP